MEWELPDQPLRASVVGAKLMGLIAIVTLAWVARAALPIGGLYLIKALASFAATMLLAAGYLRGGHPFARLGPGNQTTTARALLVALLVALIGEPADLRIAWTAASVSAIAAALDGLDGWLARRSRMASAFGARFDMEIDALLILALSVLAWRFGKAGAWVMLSGALRYAFVGAASLFEWMRRPLPPSRRRQTICVVQVAALTLTVAPIVDAPASAYLAGLALASLCWSFLVDTMWLWRVSNQSSSQDEGRVEDIENPPWRWSASDLAVVGVVGEQDSFPVDPAQPGAHGPGRR
jgi:phosphatidylglycerophosphate synthase